MSEKLPEVAQATIELTPQRVFRYLEYDGLTPEIRGLTEPQALSQIYRVEEAVNFHKDGLPALVQDASFFAFGLVTVGNAIEQETERLREAGTLLDSMILDALGSAAVSELCEQTAYRVFDWAKSVA